MSKNNDMDLFNFMTCSLVGLSIIGVILNIYKNKICFIIWAVTNFSWMIVDIYKGIPAQAFLFAVYFLLAIFGLYKWANEKRNT